MTMEGWHMGRKESAGRQAGTARMTVGDRFWARRIRPIFDDGDLTLEQKSVFCCIVARDLDWQPFLGHFSQRLRPAFRNSTGLMYPSVECIRSLLYHHT